MSGPLPANVTFDPGRRTFTIRSQFPRRGIGGILIFMAILGALITFASFMIREQPGKQHDETRVVFRVSGLVVTIGCGLSALYLFTRWGRVRLEPGRVTIEQGWCFFRSSRSQSLGEFLGLRRFARQLGALSGGTMGASLIGTAAAAIAGAGHAVAVGRNITVHFLQLVHAKHETQNVFLTASPDAHAVSALAETLAEGLGLAMLDPTLNGYSARVGPGIRSPLGSRLCAPMPAGEAPASSPALHPAAGGASVELPAPPQGLDVSTAGGIINILLPPSRTPLVCGLIIGVVMIGIGVTVIAAPGVRNKPLALLPIGLGGIMLAVGLVNSRRRASLILSPAGVAFLAAFTGASTRFMSWGDLREVTMAKTGEGKPALLLVSDGPETWVAPGARRTHLEWIHKAIRARAAAAAVAGGKPPQAC